jgi:uncharacterized GH25 family protein
VPATLAQPGAAALHLYVGEKLAGERVAWTRQHAAAFRLHSRSGREDLLAQVPAQGTAGEQRLALQRSGTHVVAYESHPSEVALDAALFNAYLKDEGLDEVLAQRQQAGTADQPVRERFRRSAKLLLQVGPRSDSTPAMAATGQNIEIVPSDDILRTPPGRAMRFTLLYQGRPLVSALLKAWHRNEANVQLVSARTNAAGEAILRLPAGGFWLLNVVHMEPAAPGDSVQWESYWGSLAFFVRSR